jgi:ectoine hydroxylase-related dioxygenase (phytanoyl-CoA dioxygenase family)
MFLRSQNVLDPQLSDDLQHFFKEVIKNSLHEKEVHFSRAGRYCFENSESGDSYLQRILQCLLSKVDLFALYKIPVVHHSFLLAKMPGGVATRLHQDRPYWGEFEDSPASMSTAWFSLGNINEGNGCLMLNGENETNDICQFNTKTHIFVHNEDRYTEQQGALTISDSQANVLLKSFTTVPAGVGDLVFFDAYEPHCATQNDSSDPRLAFKIVFGEKAKLREFYKPVKELLT